MFNADNNIVALFIVVEPDTFSDDNNVIEPFNLVVPTTFNEHPYHNMKPLCH